MICSSLEAAQLPRSLGDAEYAIINGNFAMSSGLKLTEAVVLEKTPDHYLNVVAVKRADKDAPWARDLADAYRSKEFKTVVDSKFQGYAKPAFLQ
jgi:D-methionine transport system substrate-binding protein